MNAVTIFGVCAAGLVGLGLYGLICHPGILRKLLAFNVLGSGSLLLFGVVARRGGAATASGTTSDPVPHAIAITGLVVAFAATVLAVFLLLRLAQTTGRTTLDGDPPPGPPPAPEVDH